MALGNSIRDIEMRMRQQAMARRRGMVNAPDRKRDNSVSSTQKAIDDITAQTMQRLAGQGITRSNSGFNVNTGASGINVQGSPAVARARSGEKVVVKGEPSTYYSHTETREPATITVGGIPYTPDQVVPGTVTGRVSPFNPSGSQGGSYVQGGTSGSQAPFPDVSDPNAGLAQDPSLIVENNPFLTKGSLASQIAQQMSGVQPLPPPPPPAPVAAAQQGPVSMEQQALPQSPSGGIQPSGFMGWQNPNTTPMPASGTPGITPIGGGGGIGSTPGPNMRGGVQALPNTMINTNATGGPTSPPAGGGNMGQPSPSTNIGNPSLDAMNPSFDAASQATGVPANAIKAIVGQETGGTNYVGQTTSLRGDTLALDSGIFASTAQAHGLDFNKIVNDQDYANYAVGKIMGDIGSSDAGQWNGPSGQTVCQWGDANLPGGCMEAVARVYFGGDITGQFVDEQGRSGAEYGQQFVQKINAMGGTQPTGGSTTGYQGGGPGGGRDQQQPAYAGNGPGGGRDQQRIAEGKAIQAPPQDSGKAIAANTSDPGMGNAIAGLADNYVGTQYVYGGKTPSGWDCSGFVSYIAGQEGVSADQKPGGIPDGSHYQYEWAKQRGSLYQVTDVSQLHPGDAIFFNTGAVDDPGVGGNLNQATHVGIYLGNGKFIQALNPDQGTVISVLDDYWMSQVIGATPIY